MDHSSELSWQRRARSWLAILEGLLGDDRWDCGWDRIRAIADWRLKRRSAADRPTCAGNVAQSPVNGFVRGAVRKHKTNDALEGRGLV